MDENKFVEALEESTAVMKKLDARGKLLEARCNDLEGKIDDREEKLARLEAEANRKAIFPTGDRRPENPRGYKALFCRKGERLDNGGFKSFDEFDSALRFHTDSDGRIQKLFSTGTVSDGGALIPTELAAGVYDAALQESLVLKRARVYPMMSPKKTIAGRVVGNHSQNLYGGVIGYWTAEGATITESEAQYRSIELEAEKLACYGVASSEWMDDAPDGPSDAMRNMTDGVAWFSDRAYLRGTGSGQPLGVLNSPCLKVVPKVADQVNDTIVAKNLMAMFGCLPGSSVAMACWVISPSTVESLLYLAADSGIVEGTATRLQTGVINISSQPWTILGLPVFQSEHLNVLGDQGDILLADFSAYAIGMRQDIRYESSRDFLFNSDKIAMRAILRSDGQPLWNEVMTLADGVTTKSPFITLAVR